MYILSLYYKQLNYQYHFYIVCSWTIWIVGSSKVSASGRNKKLYCPRQRIVNTSIMMLCLIYNSQQLNLCQTLSCGYQFVLENLMTSAAGSLLCISISYSIGKRRIQFDNTKDMFNIAKLRMVYQLIPSNLCIITPIG